MVVFLCGLLDWFLFALVFFSFLPSTFDHKVVFHDLLKQLDTVKFVSLIHCLKVAFICLQFFFPDLEQELLTDSVAFHVLLYNRCLLFFVQLHYLKDVVIVALSFPGVLNSTCSLNSILKHL